MGYQSKTYSLSDEVVDAIETAKARGVSPNKFLRQLMGLDAARVVAEQLSTIGQDIAEFDQKRSETQQRIRRGARQVQPKRMDQKDKGK